MEGSREPKVLSAPIVFAVELVSFYLLRRRSVVFYSLTATSVLLWRSSMPASTPPSTASRDIVPASNTARCLIFSAVIVLAATIVIIATKGRLGRAKAATASEPAAAID